jgi:radical SAM superfamily enzyme YgiQ (UPF0313 family)
MAKIHFIYPDINTGYIPNVHHGLAQIISVLKANGQEVSLHHVTKEPKIQDIIRPIIIGDPDYVAFTIMENQLEYVKKWVEWIKKYCVKNPLEMKGVSRLILGGEPKLKPIIVGGVHATLNPEEIFEFADIVCIGEGEYPILKLLQGKKDIKNLWFKGQPKPELRPLTNNLDELPFPDYSLFDMGKILKKTDGTFAVIASRGCPMSCSYCANHALRETYKGLGTYFRFRSVKNTISMLEYYLLKYPQIKHFTFADDIFGINREWVKEFSYKYHSVGFDCNLRVEMVDEDLLLDLKSADCSMVELGIESGNEQIRSEVLNRKMTNEQMVNAFDMAHKLGLKTRSYNMVGLPFETAVNIQETIALNKRCNPDEVAVFYFYPYRGTKLYDVCKKRGFLTDKKTTSYTSESVLNLPTISKRELKKLYNEFMRFAISRRVKFPLNVIAYFLRLITLGNEVKVIQRGYQWLKS